MKKSIFAVILFGACSTPDPHYAWYQKLKEVDRARVAAGWVTDSTLWVIARDSTMVKYIVAEAAEAEEEQREFDSIAAHPQGGGLCRHHPPDPFISLTNDSLVLDLDLLTLLARSGDTSAQHRLALRHAYEGDINGSWSNQELVTRDKELRTEITELKAQIDSSENELR
jgi:hypothetical protein